MISARRDLIIYVVHDVKNTSLPPKKSVLGGGLISISNSSFLESVPEGRHGRHVVFPRYTK